MSRSASTLAVAAVAAGLALAPAGGAGAQETIKTTRYLMACTTFWAALDFWPFFDARPLAMDLQDWLATAGCFFLSPGTEVFLLDDAKVSDDIGELGELEGLVRAKVIVDSVPHEVWFPRGQAPIAATGF